MRRHAWMAAAAMAIGAGCSPALDWREVRPEQGGALALFPCKPSTHARRVHLATGEVEMFLLSCRAASARFSLSFADVEDPTKVRPALMALRDAAIRNLGGTWRLDGPLVVRGMTPNAAAERVFVSGDLPDGETAQMVAGFFAKGTRVFQASVVIEGDRALPEAIDTFFGGLRLSN